MSSSTHQSLRCSLSGLLITVLVHTTVFAVTAFAVEETRSRNRLAKESSPYLLLHAHNPVDWYPWGPEALDRAKRENKPIFLSIGYSSCYWCHVMERKVFTNEKIAKYMNEHFVNIKVDREERPDVDDIYMTSLMVYNQLSGNGGGGGWPLSMFLTPEGDPIAGATYLPPADTPDGRTGFLTAATRISTLWDSREQDLRRTAGLVTGEVRRLSKPVDKSEQNVPLDQSLIDEAVAAIQKLYDPEYGGVDFDPREPNGARFPNVPRLQLLLDVYQQTHDEEQLNIVTHSLTTMARGGLQDHLAGGFHRYSTDRRWHVPHFEKMLYDQALLLNIYSRTAAITDDAFLKSVAAGIADFVRNEMTTAEGAFCSALDAETNAIEGEYYVWTKDEISSVLGKDDAALFFEVYGLTQPSPFEHGFVLHLPQPVSDIAKQRDIAVDQLQTRLKSLRSQLLKVRSGRERPLLDDKVLTAWNGMMIQALAQSGRLLDRPQDTEAAAAAADFLLTNLRDADGSLLRTWRGGEARYQAYLDDYAFLVAALLELHDATDNDRWLQQAQALTREQLERFHDADEHIFYFTADNHDPLIARTSPIYDSVFPSGNSVTIRNLLRLSRTGIPDNAATVAEAVLRRFAPMIRKAPASTAGLASALDDFLRHRAGAQVSGQLPERHVLTGLTQQAVDPPSAAADNVDTETRTNFRPVLPTAAPPNGFNKDKDAKPLAVKIYPMYDKLMRGEKVLVAVELQIREGWHINANPSSPDFLIPTSLTLTTKQKVKLERVAYPKHEKLTVIGSPDPYHVYDGKVMVYGLLQIDASEQADKARLEFEVKFQACNERECLPPDKVVMEGELPLASPGDPIRKINSDKFPKPKNDQQEQDPEVQPPPRN